MPEITRRHALSAAAGAAAALTVAATASGAHAAPRPRAATGAPASFDEVFRGRRIQGGPAHGGHHGGHGGGYTVLIDGAELHTMRNADSTWISVVNHYEVFATPLALARAAVVELQGAPLVPLAMP
ncbi:tyrosinase cofactor [Streptomyces sp. NPDC001941]|uniref:apotyrosinase chaperone MelC1 n=1 Tax=Streptomyces sp. NPDC001941 TaxID=3154659 RepID=UPI003329558D